MLEHPEGRQDNAMSVLRVNKRLQKQKRKRPPHLAVAAVRRPSEMPQLYEDVLPTGHAGWRPTGAAKSNGWTHVKSQS